MKIRPSTYLAGPIAGLTYDQGQDWREQVKQALAPEIDAYSPLRAKEFLRKHGIIENSYSESPLSTDRGIMTRDHFDCITSDLIFCNLIGATKRVSIGSVMEVAWAFAYRKPLVLCIEKDNNIHDHPMIREAIGYRCTSIEEGIYVTKKILLP